MGYYFDTNERGIETGELPRRRLFHESMSDSIFLPRAHGYSST
jgi:hypothetical protein